MATTQNLYTGNGSTTNYSFTFEYLKQSDVKVTLNSVATTAFSFVNATTLAFTSAPGNGVGIRIYRDTAIDNLSSTFFPGSAIKAEDLNNNFTQNLYVTQEADTEVADANTTAAAAVATANDADTKATNAVSTANTASTNATTAVNTANVANGNANTAVTSANAAVSTSNTASTNATNAVNTANIASGTANTAATNASAAVATANTASANATTALNNSRESDGSGGFTSAIDKATTALTSSTAAQSAATASANSATAAQNSATAAQTSAAASANVADAFTATGTPATALTVDVPIDVANGVKLPTNANSYDQEGAIRYNTTLDKIEIRKGSGWNTAAGGATVSSTPPSLASAGDVWYDHDNGRSYVYYNDGDSNQWVEMNPSWNGSVADDSVTPAKLSTGGPNWDTNGKILVNGARSHIDANSSSYFQSTNNQTGQTATDGCVFGMSSGTNAILWNYESANLTFGTGNVSRMVIDNSGNISVGPSGASNIALNANGNITAAGNATIGEWAYTQTNKAGVEIGAYGYISTQRPASSASSAFFEGYNGDDVTVSILNNGSVTAAGILTSNRPVSGTPASTWSCFNGQNNGATTSSIKADGSAYFSGNVGVNTSNPGHKFVVKGTAGFEATNSTNDWLAYTYTDNTFRLNYNGAGADEVVIDSSGRVGIGVEPSVFNGSGDNLVISSSSHTGLTIDATSSTNSSIHFADGTTGNEAYRGYLVYRHSSDSMEFGTSGSERMRLSGAGDLYIGGTSDANADFVFSTSGSRASFYRNVGIGSANPAARLVVSNDGASGIELQPEITTNTNRITNYNRSASSYNNFRLDAAQHEFLISGSERMRITNDGQLRTLAAQTAFLVSSATGAGTSEYLIGGQYSASSPGLGTNSFRVYTNGNVQNSNNSYGAISDIKLKENIVDASSQWSDIKALRVRNYNFIEGQTHTQIGVVAQEVEAVSPGLVTESPDKDENDNDLGTTTKSVNYSVLYMKAVKALQEAMARIETLEAKVAQLEANN